MFTQLISELIQMHKETNTAMAKWENHFNKIQHGLTFDENNPDMIESSEDENCNKKLIQNDVGPSQDKSYNRHETHSMDECAQNMVKNLQAIPRHANNNNGKKKALDAQPGDKGIHRETINTKGKT